MDDDKLIECADDTERAARWKAVLAQMPKEEIVEIMQQMVQGIGPMPEVVAAEFRTALGRDDRARGEVG